MHISEDRKSKLDNFCKQFNLVFKNYETLNIALTHSSCSNENYERLEFLGDSVLKIVISEYLFNKFENEDEGFLTKIRAEIVSDKTISKFAKKINLNNYILLGTSEIKHGLSDNSMINACVFEALLGAIYLETKNLKKVGNFIFENFSKDISEIEKTIDLLNPKAMLQEYTQKNDHNLPQYIVDGQIGSEHNKIYEISVYYNDEFLGKGSASTKKEAEKEAAKCALIKLGIIQKEQK